LNFFENLVRGLISFVDLPDAVDGLLSIGKPGELTIHRVAESKSI